MQDINNKEFIIAELPTFNPISQHYERMNWWREQKRRMMEGYWVSGKWMPGNLYFYVNFCFISISDSKRNKSKVVGRPYLRDLEWDKAFVKQEAAGFSGFELDEVYTCDRRYGPEKDMALELGFITEEEISTRIYVPAREYLRKNHGKNLGKPLYNNDKKNIIDLESRDSGKSWTAASDIVHEFLTDGCSDYDYYIEQKKKGEPLKTEILVGAIDSFYSSDLLRKVKQVFKYIPGSITYNDEFYPSPISTVTTGSFASGKTLISQSSGSMIHHRTFKDDPLAAAGTRCSKVYLEEVGFMNNIKETLGALKDVVSTDAVQFGVIHMFGTGGLVNGAASIYTYDIFFNPHKYNCLGFDDIWEGRKRPIGYFVPATMALTQFKEGDNLITNYDKAYRFFEHYRQEVQDDKTLYANRVINRPLVPSEIFLTVEGNFFKDQMADLKIRKDQMHSKEDILDSIWTGFCVFDKDKNITWKNTNDQPIREYPFEATEFLQGCVEIFEHPIRNSSNNIPSGIYIAGTDPVDDDDLQGSLQSTFIMNRLTGRIVAEYTARHKTAKEYYENLRRLLIYYNATCNYENAKKGLYQHFVNMNSTYLLAATPKILRDQDMVKTSSYGNKGYGTPASEVVNRWGRDLIKEWLISKSLTDENILNVQSIKSPMLVEELIRWNPDGNFDRVSALGMLMILAQDKFKIEAKIEQNVEDNIERWNNHFSKLKERR
jgi:hypothetical protein